MSYKIQVDQSTAVVVASELVKASVTFRCEPMPFDEYELSVKTDQYDRVKSILSALKSGSGEPHEAQ